MLLFITQVTLYVGLVAFSLIIITLCFVASLATSSPSDPTRRYCRACCHRFLRLRDEPELPPEVTSSASHPVDVVVVDEPPSYEQALVMLHGGGGGASHSGAGLRCAGVDSRDHLVSVTSAADTAGSVTSPAANISVNSPNTPVADHSPPNYFEVQYKIWSLDSQENS